MSDWCTQDEIFLRNFLQTESFEKMSNKDENISSKLETTLVADSHSLNIKNEILEFDQIYDDLQNEMTNGKKLKRNKLLVWMGSSLVEKGSIEYEKRRRNNNEAVKRCRKKWIQKQHEKEERIRKLETENGKLLSIVFRLKRELNANNNPIKNFSPVTTQLVQDKMKVTDESFSHLNNTQTSITVNIADIKENNDSISQDSCLFECLTLEQSLLSNCNYDVCELGQIDFVQNDDEWKIQNLENSNNYSSNLFKEDFFSSNPFDSFNNGQLDLFADVNLI
jgi:hypothetical protein